jgi:lysophospholipase L1-like esterase
MENSRREFIKKVGLTGIVAMNLPEVLNASSPVEPTRGFAKEKGFTFLFQGDSITDGNRTRDNDWNHIMGHGYAYLIASRLWYDHTDKNLMFYNRGISGNRVRDLDSRWQQDAIDLKPDVISILVGVNDVLGVVKNNNPESAQQFEDLYKRILDKTRKDLPNTLIVLCEPFILPLGWVNEKTEIWNEETLKRQLIVRKLSESYQTSFVELQAPFTKACQKAPSNYWIWDGVHPMPAGHELIARLWISEAGKKLPFLKK